MPFHHSLIHSPCRSCSLSSLTLFLVSHSRISEAWPLSQTPNQHRFPLIRHQCSSCAPPSAAHLIPPVVASQSSIIDNLSPSTLLTGQQINLSNRTLLMAGSLLVNRLLLRCINVWISYLYPDLNTSSATFTMNVILVQTSEKATGSCQYRKHLYC